MNVLQQNLFVRVVVILGITLLLSLAFYFLEFSTWAEGVREAALAEADEESSGPGNPLFAVIGSLLKATVIMGIPFLITRLINRFIVNRQRTT